MSDFPALSHRRPWPLGIGIRATRSIHVLIEAIGTRTIDRARLRLPVRDGEKRRHLDAVIDAFRFGYVAGCRERGVAPLLDALSRVDLHRQGFACEGAAMALALDDTLAFWRGRRFDELLAEADRHRYLLHVGAGWAFARIGRVEGARFRRLDPLLRWLAIDAAGFHDGFLRAQPSAMATSCRARLSAYGARAFDQGLGRSLWFTTEADPGTIAGAIHVVARDRQPDLWSGVGLACAYAGGVAEGDIATLTASCGQWRVHLAQGVAFAAEAHQSASGSVPQHTERASRVICNMPAGAAAQIARDAVRNVSDADGWPAYETWRARIRAAMMARGAA